MVVTVGAQVCSILPVRHDEPAQSLLMPTRVGQKNAQFTSVLGTPLRKAHTCPVDWLNGHTAASL